MSCSGQLKAQEMSSSSTRVVVQSTYSTDCTNHRQTITTTRLLSSFGADDRTYSLINFNDEDDRLGSTSGVQEKLRFSNTPQHESVWRGRFLCWLECKLLIFQKSVYEKELKPRFTNSSIASKGSLFLVSNSKILSLQAGMKFLTKKSLDAGWRRPKNQSVSPREEAVLPSLSLSENLHRVVNSLKSSIHFTLWTWSRHDHAS